MLVLRGPAGIGKSALAQHLRTTATERGARLVTTTITEAETSIGWAAVATLLHALRDAVEERPAEHRSVLRRAMGVEPGGDPVEPLAVSAALADILRTTAAERPLVILIDDVHWLDAASAGAISFAVRLSSDIPVLLAVAHRPESMHLDLARTVDAEDMVVIEPTPLSVAGVRDLLRTHDVELGRVDLVRLHTASGGNPMHVIESAKALQRGASLHDALLPASLSDLVDRALSRVAPEHVPLLSAAALMPSPTVHRLEAVESPAAVRAALTAAEAADVIHIDGDIVTFRHPLLRAGLPARLGTFATRTLHRRLADLADDPVARAAHLAEAAVAPDAPAADELEVAARAAGARGMRLEAALLAQRALEVTDPADADSLLERRLVAADAALTAGEARRTLDLLLPVIDDIPPGDRLYDALRLMLVAHAVVNGTESAIPLARRLLDALPNDNPRRPRAHTALARTLLFADMPAALEVARAAEASARARGVADDIDDAFATRLIAEALIGEPIDIDAMRAQVQRAVDAGRFVTPPAFGELTVWVDQLDLAELLYEHALAVDEGSGEVPRVLDTASQLVDIRLRQGRLADARALGERTLALGVAADFPTSVASCLGDLAVVEALSGRPYQQHVRDLARRDLRLASSDQMQLDAVIGHAELIGGRTPQALSSLRAAHERAMAIGFRDLGALPYHGNLVEALVTSDAIDEAIAVLRLVTDTAHRSDRPRGYAEAARCAALVRSAQGDLEDAARAAEASLAAHDDLGLPIERGRVLLLAAAIARRRKQRGRARTLLEAARELFTSCEAWALVGRVEAELKRLGGQQGGDLTATEARIARLVLAGRTNDEIATELFVSRRTVESNLTSIYRKLGVRSRTQLAAHGGLL